MESDDEKWLAFPEQEYKERVERLQSRMKDLGLDGALVSCRTNLRWLTGFVSPLIASRLRSFMSVVGLSEGVTLVAPPDVFRASTGCIDKLKRWDSGQNTCTKAVIECVREIIGSLRHGSGQARKARVGIELGWGSRLEMCHQEAVDIQNALDACEIIDIAPMLWQLRAEKSPSEIEKVARACALTDRAITEFFPAIEPGISERDVENMWSHRMIELGGESAFVDIAVGPERVFWANNLSRPNRMIAPDDLVSVDGGCCVDGYQCDICRTFSIKRPADRALRIIEGIAAANRATTARLAPGLPTADVDRICREEMKKHGLEAILNTQGIAHSVGLDVHEPPECGPGTTGSLRERMTMCIEPWSIDPELGLFNVEDVVAIDGNHVRRLTSLPQGMYCVQEQRWLGCE